MVCLQRWAVLPGEPPPLDDTDVDDWLPRFVVFQGPCLFFYLLSTGIFFFNQYSLFSLLFVFLVIGCPLCYCNESKWRQGFSVLVSIWQGHETSCPMTLQNLYFIEWATIKIL